MQFFLSIERDPALADAVARLSASARLRPQKGHETRQNSAILCDSGGATAASSAAAARGVSANPVVTLDGAWGSAFPIVAGLIARAAARPLLLICSHTDEADDARDDIESATGRTADIVPQLEYTKGDTDGDAEMEAERLRLVLMLSNPGARRESPWVIAPIQALMQPFQSPDAARAGARRVAVNDRLDPAEWAGWLDASGFSRADQVEVPGDYSIRGGIIDVFSHAGLRPIRIELFGDTIESIREFDAGTQRSDQRLDQAEIIAPRSPGGSSRDRADSEQISLLSVLPADTIVALIEPGEIQEIGRAHWQRLGQRLGLISVDAIFRQANAYAQLHLRRFGGGEPDRIPLDCGSVPQFEGKPAEALDTLRGLAADRDVIVMCESSAERQRFIEHLQEPSPVLPTEGDSPAQTPSIGASEPEPDAAGSRSRRRSRRNGTATSNAAAPAPAGGPPVRIPIPSRLRIEVGALHRGFRWGSTVFVPHAEVVQKHRTRRTIRRIAPSRPIDSFFDLNTGDAVVHAMHGIGRFMGLQSMERGGKKDEYLLIEFADHAHMHVPVSQVHVVQKYIGSVRGKAKLSKLGGNSWKKTRDKVAESITDLAAELLAIQAQRASHEGIAYPADTAWQREFEGAFSFTETPDQLRAATEIKGDMTRPRPMDRLLCGDVGFGKTEIAMRAAFKAIEFGKQVAVLVPTTVLAEQHHESFRERFADYPFSIESISRFRTRQEQNKILQRARKGQIDVLIGTHRLLSADVHFADLGLVIIDEEQRFGVEAKERLKRLRAMVDVLTLSATPIPRTLHMSMLGMRDISSLQTPPVDRRAIVTQIRTWDDELIRESIQRELARDGQVYFVHNFVRDIHQIANRIRELVPEARIVVGHGQMSGDELEEVMLKFMHKEADILVSTSIIESGLDIPAANTMFIHRAERFGLADLHQLRGRVGRYKHRAYCYLMLSPGIPVADSAARRLKAIEHYSDLGAGFQIAMRDLEIRGAGNILGPEQSGNIEAVGYEMYCQLLEQAVRRLKNEPGDPWRPVNLELGITATIPRAYIRAEKQRMEVYKRLASSRTVDDVHELASDLRDAFGPPPDEVQTLLAQAEIRALAAPWGIRSIVKVEPDLVFTIDDLQTVQPLFAKGPGSPRVPDAKTIHWRLPPRLFSSERVLEVLRDQLAGEPD